MTVPDKKSLSERDICTKYITPAIEAAGWDIQTQVREEFSLTAGRVIVKGRNHIFELWLKVDVDRRRHAH